MNKYATTFRAICQKTGEINTWSGPVVTELTQERAQQWCNEHKGYLKVIGQVPTKMKYTDEGREDDFLFIQEN